MATFTTEIDDELLRRASDVARARGETLETAFERLLRVMTPPRPCRDELPPITRSLLGIFPAQSDENDRRTIQQARLQRYEAE
jgi:hypothetical protein